MEILIIRSEPKRWGIDGHLYINRHRICDTVEHPKCCLPAGEYEVTAENNPFRHGDGALRSLHGEIIVGKYLLPGVVTSSQQTYDRLSERLRKAFQRGNTVRLRIVG